MPNVGDLKISITAQITHQFDFAFQKNNLDIANQLRAKFLSERLFGGPSNLQSIEMDDDDDIALRTNKGTLLITDSDVMVVGRLGALKALSDAQYLDELAHTVEWLFEQRSSFMAELYAIRIFIWDQTISREGRSLLESRFDANLKTLFGDTAPSGMEGYRILTKYERGAFDDTWELDVSKRVQLRFSRESHTMNFESYRKFLRDTDLPSALEPVKALLDIFVQHESDSGVPK